MYFKTINVHDTLTTVLDMITERKHDRTLTREYFSRVCALQQHPSLENR